MKDSKPWRKWKPEEHMDEAERLAKTGTETGLALAQVHAMMANTLMVQYQARARGGGWT